jgi:hypothetical protein
MQCGTADLIESVGVVTFGGCLTKLVEVARFEESRHGGVLLEGGRNESKNKRPSDIVENMRNQALCRNHLTVNAAHLKLDVCHRSYVWNHKGVSRSEQQTQLETIDSSAGATVKATIWKLVATFSIELRGGLEPMMTSI